MPLPKLPVRPRLAPVTGGRIAQDAGRWIGRGYVYGGPASSPGDWDCSSFVSYVLGHDLGMGLPGGQWGAPGMPPAAHGPVVTSYATWGGARTVGRPAAGDLCIWVGSGPGGHIGIAVSDSEMVSALNPTDGTQRTPIAGTGPAGAPLIYRRLTGLAPDGTGLQPVTTQGGHPAGALIAAGVVGVAALAAVVTGAALIAAVLVRAAR